MPGSKHRPSYTERRSERQSPPYFRAALLAFVAVAMGGCSQIGGAFTVGMAGDGRNFVAAAVADHVDPSDWEAVRQALASLAEEARDLAWQNPRTGSSGTLTVTGTETRDGDVCRDFATTLNDVRGVRRYRGEACRGDGGGWRLSGIIPDDSVLL